MTNWTKGPWFINDTYSTFLEISGNDEIDVCQVEADYDELNQCYMANNENKANAHLIASAPDLYEALESMCYFMSWKYGDEDQFVTVARKALAKARGES